MNRWVRTGIVFAVTIAVILILFWLVLPRTPIPGFFGSAYWGVAIIGSLVISFGVSSLLNKIMSRRQ